MIQGNDGYEGGGDSDGHDSNDGGDVIPPDPKGYVFKDPEDFELDDADRDLRESFRPVAHRLGLKQSQVDGLHDWQISHAKLIRDAEKATYQRAVSNARSSLEKEWAQISARSSKGLKARSRSRASAISRTPTLRMAGASAIRWNLFGLW